VSRSGATRLLVLVLSLASPAIRGSATSAAEPGAPADDPRSRILVREDCTSSVGHRDVTLFANGTVRLRTGSRGSEQMTLGEATPEEVESFVHRLAEPDLSETEPSEDAPGGAGVESCVLQLALPDQPQRTFRYGRYSTHSLALQNVLRVVRDLEAKATASARANDLPLGYEPREGDVLERTDGVRFEVVSFTADGKGVELSSPDQPLTVYVLRDELRRLFVHLVSRRDVR
jgi:hypothetical protein